MSVVILGPLSERGIKHPLYSFQEPVGFASPAVDYIERHVSLDEMAEVRAPHSYLAKILGDSMIGAGIFDNCLFRLGFRYSKAKVLLMDLRQSSEFTDDFLLESSRKLPKK